MSQSSCEYVRNNLKGRTIVFVGMMASGKTKIGRWIAQELDLPFYDSDWEIEKSVGKSITDVFSTLGEARFRAGERKIISRILHQSTSVLATGGGAFMDTHTQSIIRKKGISLWLKADVETLYLRIKGKSNRPLLNTENPKETLVSLLELREPIYAKADIMIHVHNRPKREAVDTVIEKLKNWLSAQSAGDL